ncbi:hypothetical protein BS78_K047400 [Paspalum vaginatum]|uniref:Protein MIZU-KUSSEI 1 n=1 Tax=Paspalum vaginatum TaxID=158149 RepID=A0A9W8CEY4_9POAL|nr:hypothetical protein BS78_K047400 [Paspalum vaginatum]
MRNCYSHAAGRHQQQASSIHSTRRLALVVRAKNTTDAGHSSWISMEKKKKRSSSSSGASSSYLCIAPIFSACVPKQSSSNDAAGRNNRLSFSFFPGGGGNAKQQPPAELEDPNNSESIIDPAASVIARKDNKGNKDGKQQDGRQQHCGVIVGTIFGRRTGHVTFCVQRDAAAPPPFLFELAVPMQSLAAEIGSGLLRIALECHRGPGGGSSGGGDRNVWRATCNGRDVGHAVRRRPTDCDRRVLESMRAMSSGVGVLPAGQGEGGKNAQDGVDGGAGACGEVLYMRATYERVVGSRDAVSYHLISPAGGSPAQELSVFLLRTRAD